MLLILSEPYINSFNDVGGYMNVNVVVQLYKMLLIKRIRIYPNIESQNVSGIPLRTERVLRIPQNVSTFRMTSPGSVESAIEIQERSYLKLRTISFQIFPFAV
jgi:hypothetical protein